MSMIARARAERENLVRKLLASRPEMGSEVARPRRRKCSRCGRRMCVGRWCRRYEFGEVGWQKGQVRRVDGPKRR
jgi:hypothetical protein